MWKVTINFPVTDGLAVQPNWNRKHTYFKYSYDSNEEWPNRPEHNPTLLFPNYNFINSKFDYSTLSAPVQCVHNRIAPLRTHVKHPCKRKSPFTFVLHLDQQIEQVRLKTVPAAPVLNNPLLTSHFFYFSHTLTLCRKACKSTTIRV